MFDILRVTQSSCTDTDTVPVCVSATYCYSCLCTTTKNNNYYEVKAMIVKYNKQLHCHIITVILVEVWFMGTRKVLCCDSHNWQPLKKIKFEINKFIIAINQ